MLVRRIKLNNTYKFVVPGMENKFNKSSHHYLLDIYYLPVAMQMSF